MELEKAAYWGRSGFSVAIPWAKADLIRFLSFLYLVLMHLS
jgi:hypothetical protein